MERDDDGVRHIGRWACCCPAGMWPACGMRGPCGDWEQVARREGMAIREIDGLTKPFAVTAPGIPPVLLVPSWTNGPAREYIFAWLVGEVYRLTFGDRAVECQVGRAVRANLAPEREAG